MEIEPTKVMFELFRDWTPHEIEKVVKRVEAGLEKYVIGMKERQKHQSELQEKLQQLGFL
jgi:hypothetical protein